MPKVVDSAKVFADDWLELGDDPPWRYVYRRGSREPVVLLPGGELDSRMWFPLVSEAPPDASFVLIDIPASVRDKDEIVRGIDRILAALDIERFSLLGYAFGGFVALYALLDRSDRISALVLSHTTFDMDKLTLAKKRLGFFKYLPGRVLKFVLGRRRIMRPVPGGWTDWALTYEDDLLTEHIDKPLLLARAEVLVQLTGVFAELSSTPRKFETPILVLDSLDDPTYVPERKVQHALVRSMSDRVSHVVFDPGLGGHHTPIFSPRAYCTRLMGYLDSLGIEAP